MKDSWFNSVAHIHAQDAAIFALFVFAVIGFGIWKGMREDKPAQGGNVRKGEKHETK